MTAATSALLVSGLPAPLASAVSSASAAAASSQSASAAAKVVTERVDRHSAQVAAHAQNRRVEISGERTESERLFANPDGSLTREVSLGVERVRRSDGTWAEVDLDLVPAAGGGFVPKVAPIPLGVSGGGNRVAVSEAVAGGVVQVGWGADLPAPRIADNVATYPDMQPGIDLVVEVLRTGYEVSFMVRQRPTGQLSMPLTVTLQGLSAEPAADGSVSLRGPDGKEVGRGGVPVGFDSAKVPLTTLPLHSMRIPAALSKAVAGSVAAMPAGSDKAAGAGGQVRVHTWTLEPDPEFLADPAVQYPVKLDPSINFGVSSDSYVKSDVTSSQYYATRLYIGTPNNGGIKARTLLHLNSLPSQIAGHYVDDAYLQLYNTYSATCGADVAPVHVYTSGGWTSNTTWSTKPALVAWQGTANFVHNGPNNGCGGAGYDNIHITGLARAWADGTNTIRDLQVTSSETSSYGWKEFTSVDNASGIPRVYVTYRAYPGTPSRPVLSPVVGTGQTGLWTSTVTPTLASTISSSTGNDVQGRFQIYTGASTLVWEALGETVASGGTSSVAVPAGVLYEGVEYTVRVYGVSGGAVSKAWSDSIQFQVDTTAPGAAIVTSVTYPADGLPHGAPGVAGQFTFSPPAGTADVVKYVYFTDEQTTPVTVAATGTPASATVTVTPAGGGTRSLSVSAYDRAGNPAPATTYTYKVGQAALVEPSAGARVAVRTKVTPINNDTALTQVASVQYRRGPAAAPVTIAPAFLHGANGAAYTAGASLSSLGGGLSWDAAADLGADGGFVELAMTLTRADGTGAFTTAWVPLVVDGDSDGAATAQVGPGVVNLLTGDFSTDTTDASELGLTVARASSSRQAGIGFIPQRERVTDAARTVSATTGYTAGPGAVLTRDTARGRNLDAGAGSDASGSLVITPAASGAGTSNYVTLAPAGFVTDTSVTPNVSFVPTTGLRYRASAWLYIPAVTGLAPQDTVNGLRLALVYTPAGGGAETVASSSKASVTDAWQQLSIDATVPAGASNVALRVYSGFDGGTGKQVWVDDVSLRALWAPFGPQWTGGVVSDLSSDWTGAKVLSGGHVDLLAEDGTRLHFNKLATTGSTLATTTFEGEPGAEDLTLTGTGPAGVAPTGYTLTDIDGQVTTFTPVSGQPATDGVFTVDTVTDRGTPDVTRYQWQRDTTSPQSGTTRLWRVVNPAAAGVTGCVVTSGAPARGCEVLEYVYAATTTATTTSPGDVAGQVKTVKIWAWDGAAVTALDAATYTYDHLGRLTSVQDPRAGTALPTTYTYESSDPLARVSSVASPGELPWRFTHDTSGANAGRLTKVTRASLVPGTRDQAGPDIATTITYQVPLTRAAGGPFDLDAAAVGAWAQTDTPTDATAIWPPQHPGPTADATSSTPGTNGWAGATVHYLNANGAEVNTATPAPGTEATRGFVDTIEHDWRGNTVRTLDASARRLALSGTTGSAASAEDQRWLAELGIDALPSDARARVLDARTVYSTDGIDVLETTGPLRAASLGVAVADPDGPGPLTTLPAGQVVTARPHEVNTFDEGKPDAATYHLLTTKTVGATLWQAGTQQAYPDLDTRTLTYGYDPVIAGSASGWTFRTATKVIADPISSSAGTNPDGANLTALVKLDNQGRPVESRKIDSAGADARTTLVVFYTADGAASDARCRNKPEWAGQPCLSYAGSTVPAAGQATAPAGLPERYVSGYNRDGDTVTVTESANGASRTTTTTYDGAGRVARVSTTGTGPGAGAAVDDVTSVYDPGTGDLTDTVSVTTGDGGGTETGRITRTYDRLGRVTDYRDADGGSTHTVFDLYGRVQQVTDSLGTTTTYTYDETAEPRGYVTRVTDSIAGPMDISYGPDQQVTSETLPGGVTRTTRYDASGAPVEQAYTHQGAPGGILFSNQVTESIHGQWLAHESSLTQLTYTYDRLGRLTQVTDAADGACTRRTYTHDNRANRKSKTATTGTFDPNTATCTLVTAPGATTTSTHTYDAADRLVDAGYVYDAFGRTTTVPANGAGGSGSAVSNGYYVNDLVASQQSGTSRMSWTLNPGQRPRAFTSEQSVGGSWANANTKVNHYDGDDDKPRWISEDITQAGNVTRMVDSPSGSLAATTGATTTAGAVVTQITDLHGDIVLEMDAAPSALTAHRFDEFGTPQSFGTQPATSGRYGWLGGAQRSAEALGGVILMGVRLYDPGHGRFLSVDPVEGGNANAYDYCTADPVNCTDLDGRWGISNLFSAVAKVAAVASWVPGPIGAGAAAISSIAYAATGNRSKALEMGLTAAAQLVGAGAAVRVGFRVAKVAAKAGKRLVTAAKRIGRGCANSFDPGTLVTLADGTQAPIETLKTGDLVLAIDPDTGESAQPVLDVIVGQGDKHLIDLTIDGLGKDLRATANHPIWVDGRGWTDAEDVHVGDRVRLAGAGLAAVKAMHDRGWLSSHTVYNLNVGNTHTFTANGIVVHNSSCSIAAHNVPKRRGLYVIHFANGEKYVGISKNIHKRIHQHFQSGGKFQKDRANVRNISTFTKFRPRHTHWDLRRLEQEHIDFYGGIGGRTLRNARNEMDI